MKGFDCVGTYVPTAIYNFINNHNVNWPLISRLIYFYSSFSGLLLSFKVCFDGVNYPLSFSLNKKKLSRIIQHSKCAILVFIMALFFVKNQYIPFIPAFVARRVMEGFYLPLFQ